MARTTENLYGVSRWWRTVTSATGGAFFTQAYVQSLTSASAVSGTPHTGKPLGHQNRFQMRAVLEGFFVAWSGVSGTDGTIIIRTENGNDPVFTIPLDAAVADGNQVTMSGIFIPIVANEGLEITVVTATLENLSATAWGRFVSANMSLADSYDGESP